jgi:hypothetical protein
MNNENEVKMYCKNNIENFIKTVEKMNNNKYIGLWYGGEEQRIPNSDRYNNSCYRVDAILSNEEVVIPIEYKKKGKISAYYQIKKYIKSLRKFHKELSVSFKVPKGIIVCYGSTKDLREEVIKDKEVQLIDLKELIVIK